MVIWWEMKLLNDHSILFIIQTLTMVLISRYQLALVRVYVCTWYLYVTLFETNFTKLHSLLGCRVPLCSGLQCAFHVKRWNLAVHLLVNVVVVLYTVTLLFWHYFKFILVWSSLTYLFLFSPNSVFCSQIRAVSVL